MIPQKRGVSFPLLDRRIQACRGRVRKELKATP
jgi:hypothetical protein